jgi:hypothetical protein
MPTHFTCRKKASRIDRTGGWVDHRAGMDVWRRDYLLPPIRIESYDLAVIPNALSLQFK